MSNNNANWSSGTYGKSTKGLKLQSDGNLVLYGANDTTIWSTGKPTEGTPPYKLVMRDNGSLVITDSTERDLWSSSSASTPFKMESPSFAASAPSTLKKGEELKSLNGKYNAILQRDGNFVIYGNGRQVRWNTVTYTNKAEYFKAQDDGNLVLYGKQEKVLWSANTWGIGRSPYRLTMQNDGNLVYRDSNDLLIWTSEFPNPLDLTLLRKGWGSSEELRNWSEDDKRNTLIFWPR